MAEMRLTVSHTGKGNQVEGKTPAGASLTFDGDGGDFGATPMQHLLAAVGACSLMDVDIILKKKRLTYANLRCECVGQRVDQGEPKPFTGVKLLFRVDGDVPAKAFEDAVRLSVEKYCSVGATIQAKAPVTWEAKVN
jgi:putative redox protein